MSVGIYLAPASKGCEASVPAPFWGVASRGYPFSGRRGLILIRVFGYKSIPHPKDVNHLSKLTEESMCNRAPQFLPVFEVARPGGFGRGYRIEPWIEWWPSCPSSKALRAGKASGPVRSFENRRRQAGRDPGPGIGERGHEFHPVSETDQQEPSEALPEEPKPVEMSFHHCHRDPQPQLGLTPERLQAQRQLCAACAVCCIFMAGEVVGGYLAHSLAIMTDAAHLLADVGSMMGSLFSLWLSTRPATRTMTFGWHRSETLGALASVVSLWMVTGILLYLAFIRLLHSDYHIEGGAMLLTASIAVCANLLMAFVLHQAGPPHSHGSRGAEYAPLEEGPGETLPLGNTSVRAAFVHVLGDLLQSLGVLAASVLIYFKPQYKAADPISTFLFSICALGSTAPTLRDVLRVLMEGTPRSVGFEPVRDALLSVPGVRATHELHLWSLTLTYHVASAHLAIDSTADPEAVLAEATSRLHSRFGFSCCTLQHLVNTFLRVLGSFQAPVGQNLRLYMQL
ncbi:zinc transporter 3 isoform 2 [Camelus ferus]|nr:zinc transporter 3 isoform 2 [Camelus ferus]